MNRALNRQVRQVVEVRQDGWFIEGKPHVILCASLFYFRIPRMYWKERLRQVKEAGYQAIDVYFPWNYHEPEYGVWDFAGEKDAAAFLQAAAEAGLWVIARPGPYICSEWDGGGLPAYLIADGEARLRQNDPRYLRDVARWYDRIMPILRDHELGRQGTVIAVQLENELDFFGCDDPRGYMSALRDMALGHGIAVPLVACAGQGNLFRATGHAERVMPTCNFYPDDRDPEFEEKVLHYHRRLAELGYPLSVTETNRAHFLLRRLLAAGSKLIGPYLQVSGTNFGFTNAVNNWGDPLAFLTTDYDFHGMIASTGETREEYDEGRLLAGIVRTFGAALALAKPAPGVVQADGSLPACAGMRYALRLEGGGWLLSLPNVGEAAGKVVLRGERGDYPVRTALVVDRRRCPLLPYEVPLAHWGLEGRIAYATAELFHAERADGFCALVFAADGEAEVALQLEGISRILADRAEAVRQERGCLIASKTDRASADIELADGTILRIVLLDRPLALRFRGLDGQGNPVQIGDRRTDGGTAAAPAGADWAVSAWTTHAGASRFVRDVPPGEPLALEKNGVYRGYGWYEWSGQADLPAGETIGLLLRGASDVLSVHADGRYEGTYLPGGRSVYVPLAEPLRRDLVIRAEIWGHSNFDDVLLPSLRLASTKGLSGLMAVRKVHDLSRNMRFRPCGPVPADGGLPQTAGDPDDCAVIGWGGWISTDAVETGLYSKTFMPDAQASSWVLHLDGLQARCVVFVNGQCAGEADLTDPCVDLTPFVRPGKEAILSLYLERRYRRPAGAVKLYEGIPLTGLRIRHADERQLRQHAEAGRPHAVRAEFPLELPPGALAWLHGSMTAADGAKPVVMRVQGRNAKVTILLDGRAAGRIWLPCANVRPRLTGGAQDHAVLPVSSAGGSVRLAVLVEAVEREDGAVIEAIELSAANASERGT